jgi:GNAT superfamily N-acetyltransferase
MLLRKAEPEDAMAVARVHVRSWQTAYRGLMPDEYLDQLRPEDRAQQYDFRNNDPLQPFTIVAVDSGNIHGFGTTAPARDAEKAGSGEIYALYVDPGQWGCGIGRSLMAAARARLVDQGFRTALLWVLAGNTRAERFYWRDRWEPDGTRRKEEIWGVAVEEVRYLRSLEKE